ncbi:hypothetical protein H4R99_003617 [Coemansia sp. RSA 1722]|nr:hypothetical protein LPJ57_001494 [Coemansia sp. RSA 486]KAJ2229809.1 hypothetical protein IWW45_006050 [Coemansia sp. RSA 485]KAJ2599702.1 hypothetical protein H4R99_003617 [Coemansia sp. RSA 1722]
MTSADSRDDGPSTEKANKFYPMHERDHFWPSGGIPPHRDTDRRHTENNAPPLSRSLIADIEPTGALPDSAALRLSNNSDIDRSRPVETSCSEKKQRQPLKSSLAGAGAGCVSSVVTCPLDVVKTRLQYQGVLQARFSGIEGYRPYGGTADTLKRIFLEEGVRGLYRGLAPMLMGYLPTWGIYFAAYEGLKRDVPRYWRQDLEPATVHVLSAMGAGATTSLLTNPIWVLKSRFMTQSMYTEYRYRSMWHAVKVIKSTEGFAGFYKGLGSSLLGVTHVAVQFPLYEQLKSWMKVDTQHVESLRILAASATSKMVASSVTYPHEVIRTRLQNQTSKPYKYRGIVHAVRLIYKEEGLRAFYRGLSTNLIRTVPASMMTLLTYELLIQML